MITIQKQSDMEQYYDKESNTYRFAEGGSLQDVDIKCDISIHAHIDAWDINAGDISYHAVCIAYHTMRCRSIQGGRHNAIHACLDNDIEYKEADPC